MHNIIDIFKLKLKIQKSTKIFKNAQTFVFLLAPAVCEVVGVSSL